MMRAISKISLALFMVIYIAGCEHLSTSDMECARLSKMVSNPDDHDEIVSWLDANVFNHPIGSSDLTIGRLGFPGRHGAIKSVVLGEDIPNQLSQAEVRPIYFGDNDIVGGVFIGRYNGVGLFVDHRSIENFVAKSGFDRSAFDWTGTRVAVGCMELDR